MPKDAVKRITRVTNCDKINNAASSLDLGDLMDCLFCEEDTSTCRSREHVLPESLGNHSEVLPPGVVCDKCNNYFASKVELPFANHPQIETMRFMSAQRSKKGRIPPAQVRILLDDASVPAALVRTLNSRKQHEGHVITGDLDIVHRMQQSRRNEIEIGRGTPAVADETRIVSRFIGKVAIETLAFKLGPVGYTLPVPLPDLRKYVRFDEGEDWPVSVRRIHCEQDLWHDTEGTLNRPVWASAFDVLNRTDSHEGAVSGEWYFVGAYFGLEFAINIAARSVETYRLRVWRQPNYSLLLTRPGHLVRHH